MKIFKFSRVDNGNKSICFCQLLSTQVPLLFQSQSMKLLLLTQTLHARLAHPNQHQTSAAQRDLLPPWKPHKAGTRPRLQLPLWPSLCVPSIQACCHHRVTHTYWGVFTWFAFGSNSTIMPSCPLAKITTPPVASISHSGSSPFPCGA